MRAWDPARSSTESDLHGEVVALGTCSRHLPESSILHTIRSERFVRDGGYEMAAIELELASVPALTARSV